MLPTGYRPPYIQKITLGVITPDTNPSFPVYFSHLLTIEGHSIAKRPVVLTWAHHTECRILGDGYAEPLSNTVLALASKKKGTVVDTIGAKAEVEAGAGVGAKARTERQQHPQRQEYQRQQTHAPIIHHTITIAADPATTTTSLSTSINPKPKPKPFPSTTAHSSISASKPKELKARRYMATRLHIQL